MPTLFLQVDVLGLDEHALALGLRGLCMCLCVCVCVCVQLCAIRVHM